MVLVRGRMLKGSWSIQGCFVVLVRAGKLSGPVRGRMLSGPGQDKDA